MPTRLGHALVSRLGRSPRSSLALALACVAGLGLLSVPVGFIFDDHTFRYALLHPHGPIDPTRLFDFATGDRTVTQRFIAHGPFPWWTDPDLRLAFFRPLSSALVRLDQLAFGDQAPWHHLHSVLWALALVAAAALVLRRLKGHVVFGAALLVFALDETHAMPVVWLANRNALVAGVFGLLGLAAHLRWRLEAWRPGAVLSALALGVGLLGAEAGLGAFLYIVAFEVTMMREGRLRALRFAAAVLVLYAAMYKLGGFGAQGSAIYLDPMREPGALLAVAPERMLALLGCLGLNLPVDLWTMGAISTRMLLVGLGALTVVLFVWLLRTIRMELDEPERRLHDFFLLGAVLSMLPTLSVTPSARLLLFPSVGAAAVLALLFRHLWRRGRRALLVLLLLVHGPIAVFHWVSALRVLTRVSRMATEAVDRAELEKDVPNLRVIALTTGDAATFLYMPLMWVLGGAPVPRDWWSLSNARSAHRLTRTGPSTLELEIVGGHFLEGFFEQVLRSPQKKPFAPGDLVELDGGAITLLAIDDGLPTRIRLELDEPFEGPDVRVIEWRDGAFRRARLPPVGEAVELPFSPGVIERASAQ